MDIRILVRNSLQSILIPLLRLARPLLRSKLFLFCEFMASDRDDLLITKSYVEKFVVMRTDIAVSRRLYIGTGDEYLKVVKALDIMKREDLSFRLDLLLDIGANIGHICIPAVRRGLAVRSMGFEPDPTNYRLCMANVYLNGLADRIVVHNTALGSQSGETLRFELSEDNAGDHRVRVSEDDGLYAESKRKVISVPSTTLDSFFERTGAKDTLIWMDVQGYEGHVLSGAVRYLAERVPIVSEFWPYGLARSSSFESFLLHLEPYGFYYDLSSCGTTRVPIAELRRLYENNKGDDTFWSDLLFL
jgi:FkbM family methyltransferase